MQFFKSLFIFTFKLQLKLKPAMYFFITKEAPASAADDGDEKLASGKIKLAEQAVGSGARGVSIISFNTF